MNTTFSRFLLPVVVGLSLLMGAFRLSAAPSDAGGKYFDFSPAAQDAYQKTISLRLAEARTTLDGMKGSEPDNLMPIFIENYIDFLTVFVHDDKAEFKRLAKNMEPRLAKIAKGDHASPYYLYIQAEIRLQWAIMHVRYNEYLAGMSDIKQSYALLEQNQRKFPDFIANKKSLGIMHAVVGNIPDEFKWAVKTLGGMSGTIPQGLSELEEVLAYAKKNHEFQFEEETTVAYSFLQLYLNNAPDIAWKTLKNSRLDARSSSMSAYALATVAMRTGQNEEAVRILQAAPVGGAYYPFPYRDFMLGLAKLRRMDADANKPLEAFLANYKGENSVKEACQKLAWHCLVHGNEAGYIAYMNEVKLKGAENSESDKSALREARSGERTDKALVSARLLFDGGYYQRANDLLKNTAGNYTGNLKLSVEYAYRMGRIAHKMGKMKEAVRFYNHTIEGGAKEPWYLACSAALQLGILHEESRDYLNARSDYKRCLDLKPEEYASGLHAQAKAGLGRVSGK